MPCLMGRELLFKVENKKEKKENSQVYAKIRIGT